MFKGEDATQVILFFVYMFGFVCLFYIGLHLETMDKFQAWCDDVHH